MGFTSTIGNGEIANAATWTAKVDSGETVVTVSLGKAAAVGDYGLFTTASGLLTARSDATSWTTNSDYATLSKKIVSIKGFKATMAATTEATPGSFEIGTKYYVESLGDDGRYTLGSDAYYYCGYADVIATGTAISFTAKAITASA
jgi:hypothetical protein